MESFEKEFASFHGENLHAVGVANGTDAIALCLKSLGMGLNDEVITASHTAVATVAGIEQAGCSPVFADIDQTTRCIDPRSIEKEFHLKLGQLCQFIFMGNLVICILFAKWQRSYGLEVIEDSSQAHGAEINGKKVGTFGSLSAYSCYPTKNLGGTGTEGSFSADPKSFARR